MPEPLAPESRVTAPLVGFGRELAVATVFLTRLPLRLGRDTAELPVSAAVRAFPVIGVGVGMVGGAVYGLGAYAGMPSTMSALLAVGAMALLTGGLHEDGLADTADGLAGGRDRAHKLAIMRDSRIGSFGVLALIIVIALRFQALSQAGSSVDGMLVLIAAAAGSRATIPAVMYLLPAARAEGLAASAGRPDRRRVVDAGAIGVVVTVLCLQPLAGLIAVAAAALVAAAIALICRREIGGYTGDTLGAAQQLAETAILIAFVVAPASPDLWTLS